MKYKVTIDFHVIASSEDNALEMVFGELKNCDFEGFTPLLFNVYPMPQLSEERNGNGKYKIGDDENTDTTYRPD